jgi:hypothetical protein
MEEKDKSKDISNSKDGSTDEMENKIKQLQRHNTKLYIQVRSQMTKMQKELHFS